MKPRLVRALRRLTRGVAGAEPVGDPSTREEAPTGAELGTDSSLGTDWRAVALAGSDIGWELALESPRPRPDPVQLVLLGRSGRQEVTITVVLDDQSATTARATMSAAALEQFAPGRVDVWIETLTGAARERVAVGLSRPADSSVAGVRWYATVKGNLSVELGPPVAGPESESPEVVALVPDSRAVELVVAVPDPSAGPPSLVLLGRRRRLEVVLRPTADPARWSAVVPDADLTVFGRGDVAVLVEQPVDARTSVRRRLAAGWLSPAARPGAPRRWDVDDEGLLRVRTPTERELVVESGLFDEVFYRSQVPGLAAEADPVEHYLTLGADEGLDPCPVFATTYYRSMNSNVRRRNPLAHYCDIGWRELLNPSPSFDTWWYWSKHLDPADQTVNPLAHFQAVGRDLGLSTHPDRSPSRRLGPGHRLDPGRPVRRVCLFAGYDAEGIVDDYVVAYVRELSRHADVYYLADSTMPEAELAKLAAFTRGAWGIRHGEYDFGSYARLVDKVGWGELEQYDELLLVNDSSYLLRPLDEVFDQMRARPCDWWGLQATKGIYATRDVPANQFSEPIPMERVRTSLIDEFERDYRYDFLVGSYFLVYRQPVLADPEFRRYLTAVTAQSGKRAVVLRYEVGMTRWLIQHRHAFDTFAAYLYPFHPVYSMWYFRLLEEGFPLLKRFLLSENHYRVPGLWRWPELVRATVPGADIASFERNLRRVVDPERLEQNLHVADPARPDLQEPHRSASRTR